MKVKKTASKNYYLLVQPFPYVRKSEIPDLQNMPFLLTSLRRVRTSSEKMVCALLLGASLSATSKTEKQLRNDYKDSMQ